MNDSDRLDEILGDWQERRDQGDLVDPEEVIQAHPDLADELRARFAALHIVEQAYAEAAADAGEAPQQIGEYRIVRELGRGGMGVVYEAEQTSMGRRVALKVLFPSIVARPDAVRRFRREAQTAGRIHHTNILPVYALGREGGTWYYAMELVRGSSLDRIVRELRRLDEVPGPEHMKLISAPASTTC